MTKYVDFVVVVIIWIETDFVQRKAKVVYCFRMVVVASYWIVAVDLVGRCIMENIEVIDFMIVVSHRCSKELSIKIHRSMELGTENHYSGELGIENLRRLELDYFTEMDIENRRFTVPDTESLHFLKLIIETYHFMELDTMTHHCLKVNTESHLHC